MPEAPGNAQLEELLRQIPALAELYDRFPHALDPDRPERDEAEKAFNQELSTWFDCISSELRSPLTFRDFRRAIILHCKRYLRSGERPTTLLP